MKKYWPLVMIAAYPYILLIVFVLFMNTPPGVWMLVPLAIAAAVIAMVVFSLIAVYQDCVKQKRSGRELLRQTMIIKLIQIPAYAATLIYGVVMAIFVFLMIYIPLLILIDILAIAATGLLGFAGVVRAWKEGSLDSVTALICGILQFVFCIDVVAAIAAYVKARQKKSI